MNPEELSEYIDSRIDARMEQIADLAAKKALQNVYAEVGKSVVRKALWIIGVAALALLVWLTGTGRA